MDDSVARLLKVLEETAPHLWRAAVAYLQIQAVLKAVVDVLALTGIAGILSLAYRIWLHLADRDDLDRGMITLLSMPSAGVVLLVVVIVLGAIAENLAIAFQPEGAAVVHLWKSR